MTDSTLAASTPAGNRGATPYHRAFATELRANGIDTIYGLLGDANLFVMNAFDELDGCRFVSVAHEGSALLAANGYHQVTGRLGVATVTHGPGLANTTTSLIEAVKGRSALLLIAGDTSTVDRNGLQKTAQRDLVVSTGAGFELARGAETIAADVARAIRRALTERRPIVLNVPIDLQWVEAGAQAAAVALPVAQTPHPDPDALDRACGVIASARRPILLAGRGATSPGARDALLKLAATVGAPLATTLRAMDLFRGHPHDLGICGASSGERAQEFLARADCIIAFGASLNRWTTLDNALLQGRAVVQIDVDPAALGQWGNVTAGVVGDTAVVAQALNEMLADAGIAPFTSFSSQAAGSSSETAPRGSRPVRQGTLDINSAVSELDRLFPADRTLVVDGGRFAMSTFGAVHVSTPTAYVHTLNFSSIGLGMGHAIGAAAGSQRPVLLISGDGGFMLGGLLEFHTAVRHQLDIVVAVLNDGGYGAEYVQLQNKGLRTDLSLFDWPPLSEVAESLGGQGFDIRDRDQLRSALAAVERRDRPVLLDIHLDPDQIEASGYLYGPAI